MVIPIIKGVQKNYKKKHDIYNVLRLHKYVMMRLRYFYTTLNYLQ